MAVIVTNDFPPSRGGIQRMMLQLAQQLTTNGEEVVVVAPRQRGSEFFDNSQSFRISRYPAHGRLTSFLAMMFYLLRARLATRDPLTVASIWFPSGLAACLLPRLIRGRLAVMAHGTEIAPMKGGLRRRLMRFTFGRADLIVANSRFTADLIYQAGVHRHIAVVNPGVDASPILPARAPEPTILSVGRLIGRKGFDTMISALPLLLRRFPNARYEIVGDGPQRAELEQLALRLGVSERLRFYGAVSDEEMRAAYARAWLFALPVRAVGSDVEGFGLVYVEAALAQLPAIGGKNSGASDAIVDGETGLLVDGESVAEVVEAVTKLLENPERAAHMGRRGFERALSQSSIQYSTAKLSDAIGAA